MKTIKTLYIGLVVSLIGFAPSVSAQINPPMSMYFLNEYIYNPAMAGKAEGVTLGLSHRNILVGGNNGETNANQISAEFRKGKNGFAAYANIDKDGVLNANDFGVSYSYNLKLDDQSALRFGLSAGASALKLALGSIVGDITDPQIINFNDRGYVVDGDLGVNYSNKKLSLSAVGTNMRALFGGDEIYGGMPQNRYFFSASYVVYQDSELLITPKLLYRGMNGSDDIIDAGVNAQFGDDKFNLTGFYHSNNLVSLAAGFNIIQSCKLQAAYSLPLSKNLSNYTHGTVELGLRFNLAK